MKIESVKKKFLSALCDLAPDGGVLVALSGGADSVCMLDLFLESGFKFPIMAAHLNHNLRGEESDRDEEFCRTFCKEKGVKLFVGNADVKAIAKSSGKGIEEAARTARYDFLQSTLAECKELKYIATAHNKGDMCETMILNLARGAGLDGMCSIPVKRGNIIRPILKISRSEIIEYNEERKLSFVTDSTNLSNDYSRNRVRLNVLPEIEKLYSGYDDNFERSAALLRRDADFLASLAKEEYTQVTDGGVLYTKKAQNLHPTLLSRVVRMLYNHYGFSDLTESHTDAICKAIYDGSENFSLSLHSCFALCERGQLQFVKELPKATCFSEKLILEKEISLPCGICVKLSKTKSDGAYPLRADALRGELTIRSRNEGDTVTIFGKTHKIKRIISDKKLSSEEKAKLFFVCADGEIIYSNIPATSDTAFCRKGDDCFYITVKEELP